MKTLKAYRYGLKQNTSQVAEFNQYFGAVRFINFKRFGLQQTDRLSSVAKDSEQDGISCGVKCSSLAKLARTRESAKGSATVLNRSPEANARVGNPTWRE